jgi:hypothetical protein
MFFVTWSGTTLGLINLLYIYCFVSLHMAHCDTLIKYLFNIHVPTYSFNSKYILRSSWNDTNNKYKCFQNRTCKGQSNEWYHDYVNNV